MKLPASLRTAKGEQEYADAEKNDIAKLPYSTFQGMKLVKNEFPYSAFYKTTDMLLARNDEQFLVWWMRVGMALDAGLIPHDQFIYNIGKRQSQPHIPHGMITYFKDREDFEL